MIAAVVLAAGASTRMGLGVDRPKQFLDLRPGERIVDRVVRTAAAVAEWVGVVLPPDTGWDGMRVDAVLTGGPDRAGSVAAGVAAVPAEAEIVLIHSASHPLASVDLARRVLDEVLAGADGVMPLLPAADTIKRREPDGSLTTVGRDGLGSAQAPMAYRRTMLDAAFDAAGDTGADGGGPPVDESLLVEAIGGRVIGIDGEPTNLHVTDPASLEVVRHLAALV